MESPGMETGRLPETPEEQIKIAAGLHGVANMLNYNDYIWDKYRIGEWLNVTDPATGKPAAKNLFYKSERGLKKECRPASQGRTVFELPHRARRAGARSHSAR